MNIRRAVSVSFLSALATAQQTPADPWIAQLADAAPAVRAAARDALLALGVDAVAPLAAQLGQRTPEHAVACLQVLNELGPQAGAAVPELAALLKDPFSKFGHELAIALLTTLAELLPFHEGPDPVSNQDRVFMMGRLRLSDSAAGSQAMWRLFHRIVLAKKQDDPLQTITSGRDPLAVELAIERLGRQGAAAKAALPRLRAVLDREEPRLLLARQRLPLHHKAAQAILRIAPDSPEAAAAGQVLAGKWSLPDPVEPKVPERLSARISELLVELRGAEPERRRAAGDNLVALGEAAARPVATLLVRAESDDTIRQALDVLRRLGRFAVPTAPAIADALLTLPAPHPAAAMRALAAVVPWSTDVLVQPIATWGVGRLVIHGHVVEGAVDAAFLDEFRAAEGEMHCATMVPVHATVEELEKLLEHPMVGVRRRALEVIGGRGAECEALLPKLEAMLEQRQPKDWVSSHGAAPPPETKEVDRTEAIQRLAAATMLAIAPANHPLLPAARARLVDADGK